MLEKIIKIFLLIFIPLKIYSQEIFPIHTSRDKTTLLNVEKLGNKFFVFFYDSTFFDKRIKCKVFDKNKLSAVKEFFVTPKLSTFQDELKTLVISERLIYLAFIDYRNDPQGDIYSQLIDENGVLWDSVGIPVCTQLGIQKNVSLAADSQNIFIAWEDYRIDKSGDIYAQKFDFFGNAKWKENGIIVTNVEGSEVNPKISSDNYGGCYVSWIEKILKVNKIYVQYLSNSGQKLFGQFGIYISNPEASSIQHFIITDSKNDLIIFHTDKGNLSKIYFQKISKKGIKKIGLFGKELCNKHYNQELACVKRLLKDEFAVLYLLEEKPETRSIFFQVLSQGEKLKFKSPIKIQSDCNLYQNPKFEIKQNGIFIYWLCQKQKTDDIELFIQTITSKGEILKSEGLKLDEFKVSSPAKFFLFLDNPIDAIISHLNDKNGIYFKNYYLGDYKNPKIQNFNISYYEGLVKLNWELINERPGTKVIIERLFQDETDWTVIYYYESSSKSLIKPMNFDDKLYESEGVKYRVRLIDPEGNETSLEDEFIPEPVPEGFFLYQNSPNPFTESTKISFRLPIKSRVVIKLYNSRLEEIMTILDETKDAGLHEFEFYPLSSMDSGIYFYRISASGFYDVKKMIYTK